MPETPPTQPQGAVSSQMLMMLMMLVTLFIMFDRTMMVTVGNIAGFFLEPFIGFQGNYPVMTVLVAGMGMVTFSTAVRHYFINWVDTAEKQHKSKDFSKKLREANMAGNTAEVKRLRKTQMDTQMEQMTSTMDQMKPMMFTMLFLIATFAFIGAFIDNIPGATLSVPWSNNVSMNASIGTGRCCMFKNWAMLYMLISMSVAQVIQRLFKYYSFSKALKNPESPLLKKTEVVPKKTEKVAEEQEGLESAEEDEYLIIDEEDEEIEEEAG